jgi:hypothetical protein
MKCGEQYSPQHRCPKQVGLHVVEELIELLQHEEQSEAGTDNGSQDSEEELLSLSAFAAEGTQGNKDHQDSRADTTHRGPHLN